MLWLVQVRATVLLSNHRGQLAAFGQSLLWVDSGPGFKPVLSVLRDDNNRSIGIDLLWSSFLEGRALVGWRGTRKELAVP